jgi:ferredoxin
MTMRIRVLPDLCCGAQRCAEVAPQVYRLKDDGFNVLVDTSEDFIVPEALEDLALQGANACPECAIKIYED